VHDGVLLLLPRLRSCIHTADNRCANTPGWCWAYGIGSMNMIYKLLSTASSKRTWVLSQRTSWSDLVCAVDGQQAPPQHVVCCHDLCKAAQKRILCNCTGQVCMRLPLGMPGVICFWQCCSSICRQQPLDARSLHLHTSHTAFET